MKPALIALSLAAFVFSAQAGYADNNDMFADHYWKRSDTASATTPPFGTRVRQVKGKYDDLYWYYP